jgi:hypothetical protein
LDNLRIRKTVAGLIAVREGLKVCDSLDTSDVGEREQLPRQRFGVVDASNFYRSFLGRQTTF